MPLFVVETLQTYRIKYVVEAKRAEDAMDSVVMHEPESEFSQMNLGEEIITAKKITQKEFAKMVESLKEYGDGVKWKPEVGSPWMGDKVIHVVDYGGV